MFSLTHLKYFVSTVEAGSITQAAKDLYISQPALSKQLSLLEKELNCELFQRKTTGVRLTEAGEFFYEKACRIIKEAESLASSMESFSAKSTIKIGALPSIASYFLPTVIRKISESYKVELVMKSTTQEIIDLLDSESIDFAFVQDASHIKSYMKIKNLFWEPYDAIVPVMEDCGPDTSLADYIQRKLILHKHPCDIRLYFETYCRDQDLDFHVEIDLESNESIIPFVGMGLGSSILPRMVTRQITNDAVKVVRLEEENLRRRIDFLYKPMLEKIAKELFTYSMEAIS